MDRDQFLAGLRERAGNILQKLRLRRREPWNWCLQTASLSLLPFALLTHHAALLTLSALGLVAGCLALPLPPMQHTELKRLVPLVEQLIGRECAWLARPLDRRKQWQVALFGLGAPLTCWFLWQQDLGPIGLAMIVAYLLHVRRENRDSGLKP